MEHQRLSGMNALSRQLRSLATAQMRNRSPTKSVSMLERSRLRCGITICYRWSRMTLFIRSMCWPLVSTYSVQIIYGTEQVADFLTKPINRQVMTQLRRFNVFDTTTRVDDKNLSNEETWMQVSWVSVQFTHVKHVIDQQIGCEIRQGQIVSTKMWFFAVSLDEKNIANWLGRHSRKDDVCISYVIE